MKVVFRRFPTFLDMNLIKEILTCRCFTILKISQIKSRSDGKLLPLSDFLKTNPQCPLPTVFFHVSMSCHINPKCVGCGSDHLSQECNIKTTFPEPQIPLLNAAIFGYSTHQIAKEPKFLTKAQFRKSYTKVAVTPKNLTAEKKITPLNKMYLLISHLPQLSSFMNCMNILALSYDN